MPTPPRSSNRGPAAAAENRRALLAAARRVFTEQGYRVPLSAIAREAGVGQGVLYRHFRGRLDLARAVFEENVTELEELAAAPDAGAFARVWSRMLAMAVDETAFVELVVEAHRLPEGDVIVDRVRRLLHATLPRAQAAGLADRRLTPDDVLLTTRMLHGVVQTAADDDEARTAVARALLLLGVPTGSA